jgi:NADP-dependent 3-hydroxy acid dehydrogenase YdfG
MGYPEDQRDFCGVEDWRYRIGAAVSIIWIDSHTVSCHVAINCIMSLANQVALVTGAGSGIGKAVALRLAQDAAKLWLVGRTFEKLDVVGDAARQAGSDVCSFPADLARDEDVFRLVQSVKQDVGFIDILIHSAGEIRLGRLDSADVADLDRQYRVNVRAPYLLTQLLLPMLRSRAGQIVFVNSSVGLMARAGVSQYAATKHALRAVADSLRQEVNADGIRVLSIYPGRTATAMQAAVHVVEGKDYQPDHLMQPEDIATLIVNVLNLPRSAEVTDIQVRPLQKPQVVDAS